MSGDDLTALDRMALKNYRDPREFDDRPIAPEMHPERLAYGEERGKRTMCPRCGVHIPDVCRVVTPTPCPRCHGRGYFTEDPAPDCPSVAYVGTEIECPACEGSGEATP